jgi:hypothetical protein
MSITLYRVDHSFKAIYLRVESDKGILLLRQFGVPTFHWVIGDAKIPNKLTTTIFEFGEEL